MRIANAAFAQRDWAIEQAYLERIGSTFGAGVRLVDYRADHEAARKLINAWVSDQTKKRIPELIPENVIDELTRLVLVNAIYLKAALGDRVRQGRRRSPCRSPARRLAGRGADDVAAGRPDDPVRQRARLAGRPSCGTGARDGTTPLAMTLILPDDLASFETKLRRASSAGSSATLESERDEARR